MVSTDQVRRRNLIPEEVDEDDITWCILAAQSKLRAAGVPEFQRNPQYDMVLADLAGFYHYQRALAVTDDAPAEETMRRMLNAAVLELRYATDGP